MSYRFCYGPSGSGKSYELHREIISRAGRSVEEWTRGGRMTNFLYIVPEQYTMQTQKDLVLASPAHGIMNVDVLSFGRLGHRLFEEAGAERMTVLDDIGKNLILMRIAAKTAGSLPAIGSRIRRFQMISEVKSAISEFMQYGLTVKDVKDLAAFAEKGERKELAGRLKDLSVLYEQFLDYERDRFITTEETLDRMAEAVYNSQLIRSSTLVFDGFTGFTPVQYRVLEALMQCAKEVIFCITLGEDGGKIPADDDLGAKDEEERLFYLSRKTMRDIMRIAEKTGTEHAEDIDLLRNASVPVRFRANPQLSHLERSLFRYPAKVYEGGPVSSESKTEGAVIIAANNTAGRGISIAEAPSVTEEVRSMCIRIRDLVRTEGYCYRDIAVVTGDLPGYADDITRLCAFYDIPVYVDRTRRILCNPLTEAIRSALKIASGDYSYQTMFRFLRSGLLPLTREEIDLIENYCLARGVASRRKWEMAFDEKNEQTRQKILAILRPLQPATVRTEPADPSYEQGESHDQDGSYEQDDSYEQGASNDQDDFHDQNDSYEQVDPCDQYDSNDHGGSIRGGTAAARTEALYRFLQTSGAEEKMQEMAAGFGAAGDVVRQKEYEQVYRAVIDLMDQIHLLLGEEKISAADYLELIEAGFNEIRLGTLPQRVDRVLVGDIERTRVPQVKALFFLGINDGNIPRSAKTGGLISDIDRDFLAESGRELAPTPRRQLYIQRLYLYLNMTKPTDRLLLSYARTKQDGTVIRPSYLIGQIQTLFPDISLVNTAETPMYRSLTGRRDTEHYLALALREYADGLLDRKPADKNALLSIYGFMSDVERRSVDVLTEAAFLRYSPQSLSAKTAQSVYGSILQGSVTRLETAAQCYLQQYLHWGLHLKEREEYIFKPVDAGSILHDSILTFSGKIRQRGYTWSDFPADLGRELAGEALIEKAGMYHDQILYADARSAYNIKRLERILERTVDTLQFQAQQGNFVPFGYEIPFGENGELSYLLPSDEGAPAGENAQKRVELIGRIDRIDYCVTGDSVLAKVIDYKSGNRDLKEEDIRRGLQLQLMVYMEAALQMLQRRFPGRQTGPAALLYYHFDDPVLTGKDAVLPGEKDPAPEEKRVKAVRQALRPNGFVNSAEESLNNLDREFTTSSLVIPVTRLKGGAGVRKSRHVFDSDGFADLQEAVRNKICELAGHILAGDIQANPAVLSSQRTACTYCPYQDACGFDRRIAGYEYRKG